MIETFRKMKSLLAVVSSLFVHLVCGNNDSVGLHGTFPPGFMFGAATASYQIEGGWNASDKAENVWDRLLHSRPEMVEDGANGDVACDSYHRWKDDIQIAHDLGLNFYRFSISWARLVPGFSNKASKDGAKYYNNLINGLLEKGIEPFVTLYHWDMPQKMQDLGGWTNPLIADWFADYARVAFSLYADRVKMWITINEPMNLCDFTYNTGLLAPGITEPELAPYLCNKNTLMAHAKAWRIYDEEYKPKYHGKISIGNHFMWMEPKTGKDIIATDLAMQYNVGRYAHPIYSEEGGWPPSIEKALAETSKKLGYRRSKLPKLTEDEIQLMKGTYDFFCINYYTSRIVRWAIPGDDPGIWFHSGAPDLNLILEIDPTWPKHGNMFTPTYPKGLRKLMSWLREKYGDHEFFITENGYANNESDLNDPHRIQFIHKHLEQILLSIKDGANITGYTVWSLIDNLEWTDGFKWKYGLHHVDFTDPMRKRTPRASAHYYAHVIKHHSIHKPFKSKKLHMPDTNTKHKHYSNNASSCNMEKSSKCLSDDCKCLTANFWVARCDKPICEAKPHSGKYTHEANAQEKFHD